MKHGAINFAVSYDDLATRLESVARSLLTSANSPDQRDYPEASREKAPYIAENLAPSERESLGRRLLDQAEKMRADSDLRVVGDKLRR